MAYSKLALKQLPDSSRIAPAITTDTRAVGQCSIGSLRSNGKLPGVPGYCKNFHEQD